MSHHVVATAGHVDHGKSALVRALTGMEPDRWAEERRRGLTIDLGFAWTELPSAKTVSFVDVPGHERFLGNALAGLGPVRTVCLAVAVDQGWQAQSGEHRDAIAALGIDSGLIVLTRADRAPDRVDEVAARVRRELAGTGLHDAPIAVTGGLGVGSRDGSATGLGRVRELLDEVLGRAGPPDPRAPVRLWVDRAFSVSGAGSVVTGTLTAGSLHREQALTLAGSAHSGEVTVRGLQARNAPAGSLAPMERAAVNLRGVGPDRLARGDALLTPGAWTLTADLDVRRAHGTPMGAFPTEILVHIGTAAIPARLRGFDDDHARLSLHRELPLRTGDRLVLRESGGRSALAGAEVLDLDPPALSRRGDGDRRARALAAMSAGGAVLAEVGRRGAVGSTALQRAGLTVPDPLPADLLWVGPLLTSRSAIAAWAARLEAAVATERARDPLSPGISEGAAARLLALPDPQLLPSVVEASALHSERGVIGPQGAGLGPAEAGVSTLEERLRADPFRAPEAEELSVLGLDQRALAAAERLGRLLRLGGGVVVLPSAPALAMRRLSGLEQPFTTSAARQALGTTRRVAIPLLEHLDGRGWTRRIDGGHREIARG